MKWQVKRGRDVQYYDPSKVTLVMTNCLLKNHLKTAQKIHAGAHKSVCAWIECDDVEIRELSVYSGFPICYNPKKFTFWHDSSGRLNLDNHEFHKIVSSGRTLMMPA